MDNFHTTELGKALAEQDFGIIACRIDEQACTDNSAFAIIHLLEQREIRVKLSNSGYEMVSATETGQNLEHIQPQVYETLDDLLLTLSPEYGKRRTEELIARLYQLADTPS